MAGCTARLIAVEPDAGMLAEARAALPAERTQFLQAPAEATGLPAQSADAVMIASAYHWMNRPAVNAEILRLLKPGGRVQIFEYQFPKAPEHPRLNEWIRRQFNTTWKFPQQQPRGTLEDLTAELRAHFTHHTPLALPYFDAELSLPELVGLIFSQARALSYLNQLPAVADRQRHQTSTAQDLEPLFTSERLLFRFRLAGSLMTRYV